MQDLISWYNKNRKFVWLLIAVIAGIILFIQLVNAIIKNSQTNTNNVKTNSNTSSSSNYNTIALESEKSGVTNKDLTIAQKTSLQIIDQFAKYCSEGNIEEAYNLVSEDCKNQMFPDANEFKKIYYDPIFDGTKRTITAENWVGNIYKVKFEENALASGTYNASNTRQDYITIITDSNGELKLNINSYIGKQEVNKEMQINNINIKVVEKHTYMEYETYVYEITNNNEVEVILNDIQAMGTVYLKDEKNVPYAAYTHELTQRGLTINPNGTKKVKIKYYSKYISTKKIKSTVFERIIINYDKYPYYFKAEIEL